MAAPQIASRAADILMNLWDPVGVRGIAAAQDEYDGYLGRVLLMIEQGRPAEAIADHLDRIASTRMELSPDRTKSMKAAEMLVALANGDL